MSQDDVADTLQEYAEFLRLDGQEGRAHAYDKASRSVRMARYIPPNPARLDNVGGSTREAIIDLENGTGIDELSRLRERYSWYDEFKGIQNIGPARAKKIRDVLGIETLDRLALAARNGDLQEISGIGPKTSSMISSSIETELQKRDE